MQIRREHAYNSKVFLFDLSDQGGTFVVESVILEAEVNTSADPITMAQALAEQYAAPCANGKTRSARRFGGCTLGKLINSLADRDEMELIAEALGYSSADRAQICRGLIDEIRRALQSFDGGKLFKFKGDGMLEICLLTNGERILFGVNCFSVLEFDGN